MLLKSACNIIKNDMLKVFSCVLHPLQHVSSIWQPTNETVVKELTHIKLFVCVLVKPFPMLQVDKTLREFVLAYASKHGSFIKSSKATSWPEGISSQKVMAALTCIEKDYQVSHTMHIHMCKKSLSVVKNQRSHNRQQICLLHPGFRSKCCRTVEAEHSHLHAFFGTVQTKHQRTVFVFLRSDKQIQCKLKTTMSLYISIQQ